MRELYERKKEPGSSSPSIPLYLPLFFLCQQLVALRVGGNNHVRPRFLFLQWADLAGFHFLFPFTRRRRLGRGASRFVALKVDAGDRFLFGGFAQPKNARRVHASGGSWTSHDSYFLLDLLLLIVLLFHIPYASSGRRGFRFGGRFARFSVSNSVLA